MVAMALAPTSHSSINAVDIDTDCTAPTDWGSELTAHNNNNIWNNGILDWKLPSVVIYYVCMLMWLLNLNGVFSALYPFAANNNREDSVCHFTLLSSSKVNRLDTIPEVTLAVSRAISRILKMAFSVLSSKLRSFYLKLWDVNNKRMCVRGIQSSCSSYSHWGYYITRWCCITN